MQTHARSTDPETSHEAAASMGKFLPALDDKIYAALVFAGPPGLTTDEIADFTGLRLVSVSPRLKPMETRGKVIRTGTKMNKSGRRAQLWEIL